MDGPYQAMLSAINASLSPSTGWEERQRIESYLQQMKQSPEFVPFLAYILSSEAQAHTVSVRLMTLSLLQDWIGSSWNTLRVEDQTTVLQALLQSTGSPSIASAPKSFKVKLASVIGNIALRQFPQYWSTFVQDMLRMIVTGAGAEVAVLVLNFTVTDCIDTNLSTSIPSLRKQEVLGGIKTHLPSILVLIYQFVVQNLGKYIEFQNASSNGGTSSTIMQSEECLSIIGVTQSIFDMLVPIITFGKAVEVCVPPHDFFALSIEVLRSADFQNEAVNVLQSITQQGLNLEMTIAGMKKICELPLTVTPTDPDEQLSFLRTYTESAYSLLSKNHALIAARLFAIKSAKESSFGSMEKSSSHSSDDNLPVEQTFGQYCMLLVQLLRQPSCQINVAVVGDWTKVFREKHLFDCLSWFEEAALEVVKEYLSRLQSSVLMTSSNCPFDNESDWGEYHQLLTTGVLSLLSELCQHIPEKVLELVTAWIKAGLADWRPSPPSISTSTSSMPADSPMSRPGLSRGQFLSRKRTDLRFSRSPVSTVYGMVLNTVINQLTQHATKAPMIEGSLEDPIISGRRVRLQSSLMRTLEVFLSWTPADGEQTVMRLRFIFSFKALLNTLVEVGVFAGLMKIFSAFLSSLLTVAVETSAYSQNSRSGKVIDFDADAFGIARDGLFIVSTAVVGYINTTVGTIAFCHQLIEEVTAILRDFTHASTNHVEEVRFTCREILMILLPSVQDPVQHRALLTFALEPLTVAWDTLVSHLSQLATAEGFLGSVLQHSRAVTVTVSSPAGGGLSGVQSPPDTVISQLLKVLDAFYCLGKRVYVRESASSGHADSIRTEDELMTIVPYTAIWTDLYRGLVTLLQFVDGIFQEPLRSQIVAGLGESRAKILLSPSHIEIHRECGVSMDSLKQLPQPDDDFDGENLAMWEAAYVLYNVRRLIIQLLGLSCAHRALYHTPFHKQILEYIYGSMTAIENIHISQLSHRFLLIYLGNLPRSMFFDRHAVHYVNAIAVVPSFLDCMSHYLQEMNSRLSIVLQDATSLCQAMNTTGASDASAVVVLKVKYCNMVDEMRAEMSMVKSTVGGTMGMTNVTASRAGREETSSSFCRECILTAMLRNYADVLCAMFDVGGPPSKTGLQAVPSKSKLADSSMSQISESCMTSTATIPRLPTMASAADGSQFMSISRTTLLESSHYPTLDIIMAMPICESLAGHLLNAVIILLFVQDSVILRKAIAMVKLLLPRATGDARCAQTVGRQAFQAVFQLLLTEVPWATDLESDLLELLTDIYCYLVLAISDDCPAPSNPVALSSSSGGSFRGVFGIGSAISHEPRQVLLEWLAGMASPSQPGAGEIAVNDLERQLAAVMQSRKKCKEAMKAFVADCKRLKAGVTGESNGAAASAGGSNMHSVIDIEHVRARILQPSIPAAVLTESSLSAGSLADIFGGQ